MLLKVVLNHNQFKINQKMNRSIIKLKMLAASFFVVLAMSAQERLTKVEQSIKVGKDITLDLNTSYTNIIFDTWNKNTVEIEAYIEGDGLSKEELKQALKDWDVDVDVDGDVISIKTTGAKHAGWAVYQSHDMEALNAALKELKFTMADMPDFDFDFDHDVKIPKPPKAPKPPKMPKMPEIPELPELPEGIHSIHFDYEAYQKDGDKYLEKYSKEFEEKYGKDFAKKMEAWGKKFGEQWEADYAAKMQAWGEKFGKEWEEKFGKDYAKKMEAWGERYAQQMERQAERIEQQQERREKREEQTMQMQEEQTMQMQEERAKIHVERAKMHEKLREEREGLLKAKEKLAKDRRVQVERLIRDKSNSNVIKTIKIKMPKDAKLKVNVRHGELKFAASVDNIKANLSHATLIAESINGSRSSINASYSPIYVTNWNVGELNLNYTEKVELANVRQLVLNSNSSNITIDELLGNAIIEGSIGDLKIMKIGDSFSNLNMALQNTDAVIVLPKVDYALQYKGSQSSFAHPKKNNKSPMTSFSTGDLASNKNIILKTKFSNVVMR